MGIRRERAGIYFTDRKHKRLKFPVEIKEDDSQIRKSWPPYQEDIFGIAIELKDDNGNTAFCMEIPLCEGCNHYDFTKTGKEVTGKRSPCRLGFRPWFLLPESPLDAEWGDYRVACEARVQEIKERGCDE